MFEIVLKRKHDGCEVSLKSKVVEDFFKEASKGKTYSPYADGDYNEFTESVAKFKAYKLNIVPTLPSGKRCFGNFSHGLIYNNSFNMRLLTLEGLGEGVKVKIFLPFTIVQLTQALKDAKANVTEFLLEHVRPFEGRLKLAEVTEPIATIGGTYAPPTNADRF